MTSIYEGSALPDLLAAVPGQPLYDSLDGIGIVAASREVRIQPASLGGRIELRHRSKPFFRGSFQGGTLVDVLLHEDFADGVGHDGMIDPATGELALDATARQPGIHCA